MNKADDFLNVINEHKNLIFKVASVYTNTREDRDDLIQEIFYHIWKSIDSFNQQAKITTWMYRVAMNVAIHFLKREKRRVRTEPLSEQSTHLTDSDIYNEEQWAIVKAHLDTLNLFDKGIVFLYLEDKSYDEIAQIVGITPTNVGTRLHRIKEKLRQQIIK